MSASRFWTITNSEIRITKGGGGGGGGGRTKDKGGGGGETAAVVGVKVVEAAGQVAGVIPSLARLSKCST